MSATASWARRYWLELAWAAFAAVNVVVTALVPAYETVPFHFVWVSLTLVYGFRVWRLSRTFLALGLVCISTGSVIAYASWHDLENPAELAEVPLMSAMFLAMVWHARRRQAALEQVSRAASREREFVRDASHQLKTPITIASGLTQMLRATNADPAVVDDPVALDQEIQRMGRTVADLLVLASAEHGDGLIRAPVDVEDLIVVAVRRWSRTADRAWFVDVAVDGVLLADRQRLDAVLDALLENAVRATVPGERVAVVAREEGSVAVLEVSDAGVGISDEFLPRAFDRFASQRWDPAQRAGNGLGLAIVRAVVEGHGGAVALSSQVGVGTTVTVRLPGLSPHAHARPWQPSRDRHETVINP